MGWGGCFPTPSSASARNVYQYINSIQYAYKVCGKLLSVSSYHDFSAIEPAEGSIANQVSYQYDTNGNLVDEYQEHNGAVQSSQSLYVAYGYDTPPPATAPRRCNIRPPPRTPRTPAAC